MMQVGQFIFNERWLWLINDFTGGSEIETNRNQHRVGIVLSPLQLVAIMLSQSLVFQYDPLFYYSQPVLILYKLACCHPFLLNATGTLWDGSTVGAGRQKYNRNTFLSDSASITFSAFIMFHLCFVGLVVRGCGEMGVRSESQLD